MAAFFEYSIKFTFHREKRTGMPACLFINFRSSTLLHKVTYVIECVN